MIPGSRRRAVSLGLAWALRAGCFGLTVAGAATANARTVNEILYSTSFELPGFTAGSPIAGQQGWLGFYSPLAGVISMSGGSGPGELGSQCLVIPGADIDGFAFDTNFLVGGLFGRPLDFSPNPRTGMQVLVEADVKLDGPDTGDGPGDDLLSANLGVLDSGGNVICELLISSNMTAYAFSENGAAAYRFPVTVTPGQYVHFGMLLHFDTRVIEYSVDRVLVGQLPFGDSFDATQSGSCRCHASPSRIRRCSIAAITRRSSTG